MPILNFRFVEWKFADSIISLQSYFQYENYILTKLVVLEGKMYQVNISLLILIFYELTFKN